MAKASSQKFIARNRAPRVQIEYDVEIYGSQKKVQLPFVMGVMADLSGKPAEPLAPVADRKMLEIDVDNFDDRMKAMKPRVAFMVPNTLTGEGNLAVDITFEKHGRLLARGGRAQGRRAEQAARGAHPALQPADLHGRQERRRGADRQHARAIRRCCRPSSPHPSPPVQPTTQRPARRTSHERDPDLHPDPMPAASVVTDGPSDFAALLSRSSSRRPTTRARRSKRRCRRWRNRRWRDTTLIVRRRRCARSRRSSRRSIAS